MDNLFTNIERYKRTMNAPLAARMRPQTLEEYVGQTEAVGPGSWLRTAIEHDTLSSVILYGPAVNWQKIRARPRLRASSPTQRTRSLSRSRPSRAL